MGGVVNDPERSIEELSRGLRDVPAYATWRALDPGPAASVDARYEALPATTSAWIRAEGAERFVPSTTHLADDLAAGRVERVRTSGTTGPPTPLLFSKSWWDASERASWRLHPTLAEVATGAHAEAVLASGRCVGPGPADRPRTMDERTLGRVLFLNEDADVAAWTESTVRRMHAELEARPPVVLEADPWYLAAFCARAEALALALPRPRVVVLTYALPSRLHVARIGRALQAPIVSSYGSTETGYVFLSCPEGRMHQCFSSCRVDLVAAHHDMAPGLGKLLITPYVNPWACFLRFDAGDMARAAPSCPCGRTEGRILERLEGRVKDATLRAGAHVVTPAELDDAIASAPSAGEIVSYQLAQLRLDEIRLRVLATGALDVDGIAARIRAVYGASTRVAIELADALAPEPSGKYVAARTAFDVNRGAWFRAGGPAGR